MPWDGQERRVGADRRAGNDRRVEGNRRATPYKEIDDEARELVDRRWPLNRRALPERRRRAVMNSRRISLTRRLPTP